MASASPSGESRSERDAGDTPDDRHIERYLRRITVIAALGGFLFGYDTGVISSALLFITSQFTSARSPSRRSWRRCCWELCAER